MSGDPWRAGGEIADPFERDQRYQIIYADPPWSYRDQATAGGRGVAYKYPLLTDADVKALPVSRIAADDAVLFLWVTWPKLPEILPVIDACGFTYRTVGFVWVKLTRAKQRLAWGMGSWTRANTEPCLLATRGRPKRLAAGVHQVVQAPLARHSEKPDEARERIVQLMGEVPRIELFARKVASGGDAWGNDVGESPNREPPDYDALGARVRDHLNRHAPISTKEAAEALTVARLVIRTLLRGLERNGTLTREGQGPKPRYRLTQG